MESAGRPPAKPGDAYEATTLGGLVNQVKERIRQTREAVLRDAAGLRPDRGGRLWLPSGRRQKRLRVIPRSLLSGYSLSKPFMMAALPLMRTSLWGSFRPRSNTAMLS